MPASVLLLDALTMCIACFDLVASGRAVRLEAIERLLLLKWHIPCPIHQHCRHERLALCNAGNSQYGRVHRRNFAFAYQGNYWGNHHGGETVAALLAARLQNSTRTTRDASAADMFFIPFSTRNSLVREEAVSYWRDDCGIDFYSGRNITRFWRWMLAQPSFNSSDGSDHFLVIEPPKNHMKMVRSHARARECRPAPQPVQDDGSADAWNCIRLAHVDYQPSSQPTISAKAIHIA